MTRKWHLGSRWILAIAAIFILGLALTFIARTVLRGDGELARKGAYAALQSLLEVHKNDELGSFPKRDRVEGDVTYEALGVRQSSSPGSTAWIMLNMTGPQDSLLVVPRGAKPVLPCVRVEQLTRESDAKPAVLEYLTRSCIRSSLAE